MIFFFCAKSETRSRNHWFGFRRKLVIFLGRQSRKKQNSCNGFIKKDRLRSEQIWEFYLLDVCVKHRAATKTLHLDTSFLIMIYPAKYDFHCFFHPQWINSPHPPLARPIVSEIYQLVERMSSIFLSQCLGVSDAVRHTCPRQMCPTCCWQKHSSK